jgi:hypothetical protein
VRLGGQRRQHQPLGDFGVGQSPAHEPQDLALPGVSIDGDRVVDVLDRIVSERGTHPQFVRCDHGPEMTFNALRDWCRFSRTGVAFIEPGSPWENPFVESFNSRVRDELLSVEVFTCLAEAKVMVEDFRQDYNRCRPHRAHQMMTPAAFRTGWETAHEAAPASAERQPYPAGTNHPSALTAGGPMNGLRSAWYGSAYRTSPRSHPRRVALLRAVAVGEAE